MKVKVKYIYGTYRCGHAWTTIVLAATPHERKVLRDKYKENICPNCENKLNHENNTIPEKENCNV